MKIVSVQVGKPKLMGAENTRDPMDRQWRSGIIKLPVVAKVAVSSFGLVGDGQADLVNHGGVDKAICAYPSEHYQYWEKQLNLSMAQGAFGENFTTQGMDEDSVCVGDVYKIGGIVVEVSQPRQPCWKLARRWRVKNLALQVDRTGFTGWYFRVISEGFIEPSAPVVLLDRPYPEWSIGTANKVKRDKNNNPDAVIELRKCPALSDGFRSGLGVKQ